ncbi:MAG TPA: biopolymer transporter ExbD [Steroidobacteraceae bacterium]|jgi:biopolymer transport protein ExbD|nr:biopolymer transporter ExbD [Steroidobacteraceae bacterium]
MSMSSRARRMLLHQLRNRADAQINLVPMIDILTVMVAFLLIYSTNVEVLQNNRAIQMPQSISQQQPRQTVVVMLTPDELYVQGEPITTVAEIRAGTSDVIAPLRAALERPLLAGQQGAPQDPSQREITVMADKALPYEVLKRVMTTCTDANYGRISLAVMQKDKPVPAGAVRTS